MLRIRIRILIGMKPKYRGVGGSFCIAMASMASCSECTYLTASVPSHLGMHLTSNI